MTFFAHVMLTMRFVFGMLISIRAFVFLRLVLSLYSNSLKVVSNSGLFLLLNLSHLMMQGGSAQVRFQPRIGQFMAAASGNIVSIFDAESDRQTHSLQVRLAAVNFTKGLKVSFLICIPSKSMSTNQTAQSFELTQGHSTEVHSLCWDANGDYLASVSQESVRVWSLSSGECIHELSSSGNMFHSCVFHPSYSTLLVIGGYQVSFALFWCRE